LIWGIAKIVYLRLWGIADLGNCLIADMLICRIVDAAEAAHVWGNCLIDKIFICLYLH
jgi:hypothetical protein